MHVESIHVVCDIHIIYTLYHLSMHMSMYILLRIFKTIFVPHSMTLLILSPRHQKKSTLLLSNRLRPLMWPRLQLYHQETWHRPHPLKDNYPLCIFSLIVTIPTTTPPLLSLRPHMEQWWPRPPVPPVSYTLPRQHKGSRT